MPDRQTTANNWRKAILGKMEEGLTNTASYKSLRQSSILMRASSRLMNQWAFRHSALNLPLIGETVPLQPGSSYDE